MMYGMSGAAIPDGLPYAQSVTAACGGDFPPLVAYAVACRETIIGEMNGKWNAATVVSDDNGHGLFQLTSSWNTDWTDPTANAKYAVNHFLVPAMLEWKQRVADLQGDDMVRCIAASFNAGFGGAWHGHIQGNVDLYTTNNYGAGVLEIYHNLLDHGTPT